MRDFKLILHKEMVDIFRDKRSFIMLFVPVLIFPLMFTLMGSQLNDDSLSKDIPCIVECKDDAGETLYETLFGESDLIEETEVDESADEDLKNGAVYAVLTFEGDEVTLLYNSASTKSSSVYAGLSAYLEAYLDAAADAALQQQYGVQLSSVQPFTLTQQTLSEKTGESSSSIMASLAPMLLVVLIMSGGVSVAVDLFTGEKERGTFESLMTTQAGRMSILMAKFVATLLLSLMSMALTVVVYILCITTSDSAMALLTSGTGSDDVSMSFGQGASLVLICLALSVFAVSLMTLIGLNAKTVKEAQSQMSLLTILPTLVSGLTMFMESANIHPVSMWIPVFNAVLSIKMVFLGTAQTIHIVFTVLSCMLYSGIMWYLCVRILRSERLLRG